LAGVKRIIGHRKQEPAYQAEIPSFEEHSGVVEDCKTLGYV
jgi:hypothetical protein